MAKGKKKPVKKLVKKKASPNISKFSKSKAKKSKKSKKMKLMKDGDMGQQIIQKKFGDAFIKTQIPQKLIPVIQQISDKYGASVHEEGGRPSLKLPYSEEDAKKMAGEIRAQGLVCRIEKIKEYEYNINIYNPITSKVLDTPLYSDIIKKALGTKREEMTTPLFNSSADVVGATTGLISQALEGQGNFRVKFPEDIAKNLEAVFADKKFSDIREGIVTTLINEGGYKVNEEGLLYNSKTKVTLYSLEQDKQTGKINFYYDKKS